MDRGPGENNLGKFVPRFGAVSSVPAVYRLLSEPISSCFISFLLLLSFTMPSVLLFVMSAGVSCTAVTVKRPLELKMQMDQFLQGRQGRQHHGSAVEGQPFHWSVLTSYLLHHLAKLLV